MQQENQTLIFYFSCYTWIPSQADTKSLLSMTRLLDSYYLSSTDHHSGLCSSYGHTDSRSHHPPSPATEAAPLSNTSIPSWMGYLFQGWRHGNKPRKMWNSLQVQENKTKKKKKKRKLEAKEHLKNIPFAKKRVTQIFRSGWLKFL